MNWKIKPGGFMLKAILASLTGFGSDRTVLEAAFAAARLDGGHIEALHTRIDATEVAALAGVAKSHVYGTVQEIARNIACEESERSRAAQRAYADACSRNAGLGDAAPHVTSAYREVTTLANETLHQARLHDLTVAARTPELAPDRLDSLVVSAGKPVLIAPAKPQKTMGETVVLAWKDTPEAARAITAALPVLVHAKRVVVAAILESRTEEDAEQDTPEAARAITAALPVLVHAKRVVVAAILESRTEEDAEQASAEGLLHLLHRHGIAAQLRIATSATTSAAEKIKEIAYESGADLIIMGAYGHGRMRELVLGGVTRSLLVDCDIAVMMVH
jgi:nucleotide-binding universal stress UspA family protein